jgi:uncharacterized protein YkwD
MDFKSPNHARQKPRLALAVLAFSALTGPASAPSWAEHASVEHVISDATLRVTGDDFDAKAACEEVVKAHNRIRAEAKKPALAVSAKLQAAAERHAKDMASRDKMSHTGGDRSSPFDRIKAEGYQYRRAGENVAGGYFTTEVLMNGWMDSPRHKRNILGSFSQIGVACAIAESGKCYWCVTFGLPDRR